MRKILFFFSALFISFIFTRCDSNTETAASNYTEDGFSGFSIDTLRSDISVLASEPKGKTFFIGFFV